MEKLVHPIQINPSFNIKEILIGQGAEAVKNIIFFNIFQRVYISQFLGKKCIVKERFEKKYRVEELDKKLAKQRITLECRNLVRAYRHGINTPTVLFSDLINRKIYLQFVDNSAQLKEVLKIIYYSDISKHEKLIDKIIQHFGETLAKLHNSNIIHGDLTTSNMLLRIHTKLEPDYSSLISSNNLQQILNSALDGIILSQDFDHFYLIDFGLSYISQMIEDKAVDLYVLKRAIISANPRSEEVVRFNQKY